MSNPIKKKYIGRYIGIKSPKDGILIEDTICLNRLLIQDNLYALVGRTSMDWYLGVNGEWCITKIYSTKERLIANNKGCYKLDGRVFASNSIKTIHIG